MAATGKPKRYTERVLLTLEPQDLSNLNELAEKQEITRLEAVRRAIQAEHRRATRREKREEDR